MSASRTFLRAMIAAGWLLLGLAALAWLGILGNVPNMAQAGVLFVIFALLFFGAFLIQQRTQKQR